MLKAMIVESETTSDSNGQSGGLISQSAELGVSMYYSDSRADWPSVYKSAALQLLRGSVSGVVAKTVVYPFDRLKMIYQVKGSVVGHFELRAFFTHFRALVKSEGLLSLWKGNSSALCRTLPQSGISFFCYDWYHSQLQDSVSPACCRLLAGGFAGMTATIVTYPLDVLNTRMAISYGFFRYKQVSLVLQEGILSLYNGLFPTLLGVFPYAGLSFFSFETLKLQILRHRHQASLTPIESLICGGLAGIVSQTATYPLDTVRKAMQANTFLYHYNQSGYSGQLKSSAYSTARFIYQSSGFRGFYNGVSLNWIKGSLAAGIAFTIHEQLKNLKFK